MRFGKKLALAMIRDVDEAPYISQKNLKHVLVGLEKLCKAYSDQMMLLLDQELTHAELVLRVNMERAKFGLPQRSTLLEESEVLGHDHEFFHLLDTDVVEIRRYVERCECGLMCAVNEWLQAAASEGLVVGPALAALARDPSCFAELVLDPSKDCTGLMAELEEMEEELGRILQYIEVNSAAMRKLISRRNKNVPECFWSRHDYANICELRSPETSILVDTIEAMKLCRQIH